MKAIPVFLVALLLAHGAAAQSVTRPTAVVVATCGTAPSSAWATVGGIQPIVQDVNGNQCTSASVSASISGFAPASTGTPISATTGGVTGSLPAGAVVVASNVGATNGAYCKLGASATTADQLIPPNSWFAYTVGVATQLTCITSASTTTVNMVGGAGLPTGAGGGGGGGSGGSVTQGTSPWIVAGGGAAGTAASGVSTIQGIASMTPVQVSQATAANLNATVVGTGTFATQAAQSGTWNVTNVSGTVSLPTGASTAANQATEIASLATIATNSGAAIPAGTNLIGKVGIDQTTPGTTNAVSATNFPTTAALGHGTAATALRVELPTDGTGVVGLAAGSATIGALTANQSVNLAQVGGTNTVNGGVAGSQSIGGTVATNVAITANPINLGAQAVSSENAAVTTARQVQLVADLVGKLIVSPYAGSNNFVSGAITSAMTGTTSTSLVAAPASGLRNYITACTVSNAHATVGTDVIIQDGSGGTTLWTFPAAAVYGGSNLAFPTPLRQPTTATALFAQNVTTGASTKISCNGYTGA